MLVRTLLVGALGVLKEEFAVLGSPVGGSDRAVIIHYLVQSKDGQGHILRRSICYVGGIADLAFVGTCAFVDAILFGAC